MSRVMVSLIVFYDKLCLSPEGLSEVRLQQDNPGDDTTPGWWPLASWLGPNLVTREIPLVVVV